MKASRAGGCVLLGLLAGGCLQAPPAVANQANAPQAEAPTDEAPILWEGRSPADLYAIGEVREFSFEQGGQTIGHTWGRYAGPVEGEPGLHRFETRIELEVPGRGPVRSSGELVLDEHGAMVRGFERSVAAELRYVRQGDVIMLTDGVQSDEIGYDPAAGDAVMAHTAILHEEMMLGLRALREGPQSWRLVSVSGGPPTDWEGNVVATEIPDDLLLSTSLGETIQFRKGRIVSIEVEASGLLVRSLAEGTWPTWEVEGPRTLVYELPAGARFERREVELPGKAGEPALVGEVLVPTQGQGPWPAALYVSGTGQEDRYGFAGPPPVDLGSHEITDALANAGFVVMRFDERGRGGSEEGPLSFEGQIEDAHRAFRMLMVQEEVDPDRMVVVGHGESGVRVLHVAANHPREVVGVALLATPGRPYRDVFLHQASATLDQLPPQMRDQARKEQVRMLQEIEKDGDVPLELQAQAPWIREMLAIDTERLLARVKAPLWIAQGAKDFEVDPKADLQALVDAAKKNKVQHTVVRYEDLDHLFKLQQGDSTPQSYLDHDRRVDVDFLADLTGWASRVATRSKKRSGTKAAAKR